MNLQTVHVIQIVAAALGAGLPALATSYPEVARPYFLAVAATLTLVGMVLGVVSKSATKPEGDA